MLKILIYLISITFLIIKVTVFFSDMVGFTAISSKMEGKYCRDCLNNIRKATNLVKMLNYIVNGFDLLTEKYSLEKIKTIGTFYFDSYTKRL